MAFTMYSYLNETTGDLVISGQEESLDGYTQLDTPETNPTGKSGWPWNLNRDSIKTVHIGTIPPIDMTSTRQMFCDCSSLTMLDLSSFNTSQVTSMDDMFEGCPITSLDLSSFDTSQVTDMNAMFRSCYKLTSLDLSSFDTSKVTDMNYMFAGCSKLTSLDLSNFDTANVSDMRSMFRECSSLTSLDLSSFDTSQVPSINNMFRDCSSLTSLDLSSFNTSQVTDMRYMFDNCSSLHIIDIPTTAITIVSELPLENYYDAATGTQYSKANIPGGSVYVDDPEYAKRVPNIIQTRRGISNARNTINSRLSSIRNGYNAASSRRPARMYIVNDESDSESVTGRKVMRPCVLMVVGSGDVTPVYAS